MQQSTTQGQTPTAFGATEPPDSVSLPPDHLRRIVCLEAHPDNAPGADKSWVHRAHEDAVRHLGSARRR